MNEQPVKLKRSYKLKKHDKKETICIIHACKNNNGHVVKLTPTSWDRIQDIKRQRQRSDDASKRLDTICQQIPQDMQSHHGYHRYCYQQFTNVKYLQKRSRPQCDDEVATTSEGGGKRKKTTEILFPSDECIICGKNGKWGKVGKKRSMETLTKCVTKTAETSIKEAAVRNPDKTVFTKIQGEDLIAKEAKYHNSCRRDFTRSSKEDRHPETSENVDVKHLRAHQKAFDFIVEYVEANIIRECQVERMTMLCEKYASFMQQNSPDSYNPNYKTYKLKAKLAKHFGSRIQFWQPNYKSELVYSVEVPTGQAVEYAFEAAASLERRLEECGMLIRRLILDAYKESSPLPWPPSAEFLSSEAISPPTALTKFLAAVISTSTDSVKKERLISSIAQDICYAVSGGQWKMPKHLLMGMTMRHITGSAEVVSILNHFGHSISYSALLELETAMSNQVTDSDSLLPGSIDINHNAVVHFCWDNFDLNEETPSGAGTTHSTHGIVMQEVSVDDNSEPVHVTDESPPSDHEKSPSLDSGKETAESSEAPGKSASKRRSVDYRPQEIQPCFARKQVEPNISLPNTSPPSSEAKYQAAVSDFMWLFCRIFRSGPVQSVPSWKGWVSATSDLTGTQQKTKVDYMRPINAPVTENSTVKHLLETSQKATNEVGQPYTFVTFDLAVAKKAYNIIWQCSNQFKNVIVRLGVFHTIAAYLAAIGKLLKGTGFVEIIVESKICAGGSIDQVLHGRHYNRAMRVHLLTLEALERLLFQSFEAQCQDKSIVTDAKKEMEDLGKEPSTDRMNDVLTNGNASHKLCEEYMKYKDDVRQGLHGKTAQFWLKYMDKVWLLYTFLRATKENDLDLHISCLEEMCPLYFVMDHHNYARYLSVYYMSLVNLPVTHPGADEFLRKGGLSVSRSNVPGSVDMTIEQTINRHAKSAGGIVGFSRNFPAYHRWSVTRHARASYVATTLEMAGMDDSEDSIHKHLRPAQIQNSEEDVTKLCKAFGNFVNPFDTECRDGLYCLSSGAKAPPAVENELLKVDEVGKEVFDDFVQTRLVKKTVPLHSPLKKQKLKTLGKLVIHKKVTSTENKVVQIAAQRNVFGQMLVLSEEHNVSLEKALAYPLSPIPWALATPDGLPAKTDKAKLLHKLEDDNGYEDMVQLEDKVYIVDGNALLQALTGLPQTFGELAEKVFCSLPKAKTVHFVTDTYKEDSIKSAERKRRGETESFLVKGPSTRLPREWKAFLQNNANKERLILLLLNEWKGQRYSQKLQHREVLFVCKDQCVCLSSSDGIAVQSSVVHELCSSQEEADTRIILHCLHVSANNAALDIIVRSPDTDVFILLLQYGRQIAGKVYFDTGTGNRRRMINVKHVMNLQGHKMCEALLGLHAITGCDTTSAFVRKGKVKPYNILRKHPDFLEAFAGLGTSETVTEDIYQSLESFVCKLYSNKHYNDINQLRYDLTKQKFTLCGSKLLSDTEGADMSLLPPCRATLKMHVKRANYQTIIWKCAHEHYPETPHPKYHGWNENELGLDYDWCEGPVIPQELIDIMCAAAEESDGNEDDDEDCDHPTQVASLADAIFETEEENSDVDE